MGICFHDNWPMAGIILIKSQGFQPYMQVASLVSGIFFKTRIDTAVKKFGTNTFCSSLKEVVETKPSVVLVDLEHPEAHLVLRQFGNSAIAFGPHMRTDLLAVAREFKAQAYPRSVFFNELERLLHQHA
jgi:hypothetical protein